MIEMVQEEYAEFNIAKSLESLVAVYIYIYIYISIIL